MDVRLLNFVEKEIVKMEDKMNILLTKKAFFVPSLATGEYVNIDFKNNGRLEQYANEWELRTKRTISHIVMHSRRTKKLEK